MSTAHAKVWNGTAWVPGTGDQAGGVRLRTFQETVGDGISTEFIVNHSLGTKDVLVGLYETASGEDAEASVDRLDSNSVRVYVNGPIPFGSLRVLVIAL